MNSPLRAQLTADDRVAVRVLLVEADPADAEAVAKCLFAARQVEPRLTHAGSMAQALKHLARASYELVFASLDLPDFAGPAMLAGLRHATDGTVIALTAEPDDALRQQALECGAHYVLYKGRLDAPELERLLRLAALQTLTGDALRESEARFRAIYELAAVGIAIRSLDGRWLRVNQKMCEIFGYPREELMTLSSVDLTPPDERGTAIDFNERIIRGEVSTYSREKRYLRKDGSTVWVNLAVNVVTGAGGKPSHVISVIQDISDRKEAEAKLRTSEERFRSLTEMFSDFYWETDTEHRLTQVVHGGGYRRIHPPEILLGKASWDLPSSRPDAAGWAAHKAVRAARLPFRDFCFARFDAEGNERHVSISGEPVFEDGRFLGYRGVGSDVTERMARAGAPAHPCAAPGDHRRVRPRSAELHGAQVLLDHAVRSAGLALDAQAVAYYECTVDDNRLVPRSGTGGACNAGILELTAKHALGRALRSGEPCVLPDAQAVRSAFPGDWAGGFGAALAIPVRGERGTYGRCARSPRGRAPMPRRRAASSAPWRACCQPRCSASTARSALRTSRSSTTSPAFPTAP